MRIYLDQLCGPCPSNTDAVEGYIRDIRDGVPIEPITVTPDLFGYTYTIIDGRNRAMAYFLEWVSVIEVKVV
jgi:hypothetical protein